MPPFSSQLADYRDGRGEQRFGSRVYFERPEFAEFRGRQRLLSLSYHLQFSEALSNFALRCAGPIVEHFEGRLIYAGGDDVLALLPADTALQCARSLRRAFRGEDPEVPGFTSPARGFLSSDRWREHTGKAHPENERPIPFLVPGPATDVSAGIAVAHFSAPLQDMRFESSQNARGGQAVSGVGAIKRATCWRLGFSVDVLVEELRREEGPYSTNRRTASRTIA